MEQPLWHKIAGYNGFIETTKTLLNRGNTADIDKPNNDRGNAFMDTAAFNGHVNRNCKQKGHTLIDKGETTVGSRCSAKWSYRNKNNAEINKAGVTPLWIAAYKGHIETVKLLISRSR